MPFSGFLLLVTVASLAAVVAQWVGIVGLRHLEKSGAWWAMAAGMVLSSVGTVLSAASPWILHLASGDPETLFNIIVAIPGLGSLIFAIGFAMHGLKVSRSASRMRELEQLTAAMSEEINQLREKASKEL